MMRDLEEIRKDQASYQKSGQVIWPTNKIYQMICEDIPDMANELEKMYRLLDGQAVYIAGQRDALIAKDEEIEQLNKIAQFRKVANNVHIDEIIELRAKIKELRDETA